MLDVLGLLAGTALIVLAAFDAVTSTLHPIRRGPVSLVTSTATWRTVRAIARAVRRPSLVHMGGPLAVLAVFAGWLMLVWVGFALIYHGYADQLSFDADTDFSGRDLVNALYLSGVSLTTVGFGDVVAGTDALRLVTTAEAAAGFGLMTAAITYLLSLYPLLSTLGTTARTLGSQSEDLRRAADMVVHGGSSYLQAAHQDLIAVDENTRRFPLLYFFQRESSASTQTLLRGATHLCLQARWGVSSDAAPAARTLGEELGRTLDRLIEHYARDFLFVDPDETFDRRLSSDDARRRFARLVDAAGDAAGPPDRLGDPEELAAFAAFVGRMDAFLEALADQQLTAHRPLLGDEG